MPDIEAILTKPLDGDPIGAKRTFPEADFNDLKAKRAVKAAPNARDAKPEPKKPAKAD